MLRTCSVYTPYILRTCSVYAPYILRTSSAHAPHILRASALQSQHAAADAEVLCVVWQLPCGSRYRSIAHHSQSRPTSTPRCAKQPITSPHATTAIIRFFSLSAKLSTSTHPLRPLSSSSPLSSSPSTSSSSSLIRLPNHGCCAVTQSVLTTTTTTTITTKPLCPPGFLSPPTA